MLSYRDTKCICECESEKLGVYFFMTICYNSLTAERNGHKMKKRITALLLAATFAATMLAGCSGGSSSSGEENPNSSENISLSQEMRNITSALKNSKSATEVDVETLDEFFSAIAGSKFIICGKASNYNCKEYNGYKIATVTLTNNGLKYIISLDDTDNSIKDGDYLEIEGNIGSGLSSSDSGEYGSFSISNGKITERGDKVKEKVK